MSGEPSWVLDGSQHPASRGPHRGIEAAKWLAFLLMLGDHANTFLLGDRFPVLYLLGRLVFPLFAFCLAFGIAGRGSLVLDGTIRRLLTWACIAQVPWAMLHHAPGGASLNVVFELAFGAMVYQAAFVRALGLGRRTLAVFALLGCFLCEFGFPGLVLVVGTMWFAESRDQSASWSAVATAFVGLVLLYAVNGTWFALAAPLVFWPIYRWGELPRLRHAFYYLYPAHLAILAFVRWWL